MLTCENRRRILGDPKVVEPVVGPVPSAIATPIEEEEVPRAAVVAQNCPGKLKPRNVKGLIQPFERCLTFFFEEALSGFCVQANVLGGDVPHELFLAGDDRFAILEARREEHLGEIKLGEREGAGILFLFALETVAILRSSPDWQVLAFVKRLGAIDDERTGSLHDERKSVVQKGLEAAIDIIRRIALRALLNRIPINSVRTKVQETDGDILDLMICCGFHHTLPCAYAVPPSHPMCEVGSAYRRFSPQGKGAEIISICVLW